MSEMAEDTDEAGFAEGGRPLCPFCSKPFGDEMITAWVEGWGCESGGYDHEACVKITCDGCQRLIYEK